MTANEIAANDTNSQIMPAVTSPPLCTLASLSPQVVEHLGNMLSEVFQACYQSQLEESNRIVSEKVNQVIASLDSLSSLCHMRFADMQLKLIEHHQMLHHINLKMDCHQMSLDDSQYNHLLWRERHDEEAIDVSESMEEATFAVHEDLQVLRSEFNEQARHQTCHLDLEVMKQSFADLISYQNLEERVQMLIEQNDKHSYFQQNLQERLEERLELCVVESLCDLEKRMQLLTPFEAHQNLSGRLKDYAPLENQKIALERIRDCEDRLALLFAAHYESHAECVDFFSQTSMKLDGCERNLENLGTQLDSNKLTALAQQVSQAHFQGLSASFGKHIDARCEELMQYVEIESVNRNLKLDECHTWQRAMEKGAKGGSFQEFSSILTGQISKALNREIDERNAHFEALSRRLEAKSEECNKKIDEQRVLHTKLALSHQQLMASHRELESSHKVLSTAYLETVPHSTKSWLF